ncbi:MAG: IS3 family transposase [Candidatus Pacebacteria bacterium]|nr:IS3 family transposase [Candidatus Paceibacterota bacterium]
MEVSRSGYYAWKNRLKSQGKIENEKRLIEIKRLFIENKETYGSPRIYDVLNKARITCSENRVAKLIRAGNLIAVQRRKIRITTNSNHKYSIAPNLLQRNFIVDKPNKVWVSDITYVWTLERWLYLASVLDLYSRGLGANT